MALVLHISKVHLVCKHEVKPTFSEEIDALVVVIIVVLNDLIVA